MRLLTAGRDESGKDVFTHDGEVTPLAADIYPVNLIWAADGIPEIPNDGTPGPWSRYMPPVGSVRISVISVPPDDQAPADDPETLAALSEDLPGLTDDIVLHPDDHDLHMTRTIDIGVVIEGSTTLELDSGQTRELRAGDWYVLNGSWHRWSNPSDQPCRIAIFMIGATEG